MNTVNQSSPEVNTNSVRTSSYSSETSGARNADPRTTERTSGSLSLPDDRWLVETTGLVKSFREGIPPALDHLDTRVAGGAITGLAGPDGAGKTTLMRLLAGFVLPPCGEFPPLRFLPSNPPAR